MQNPLLSECQSVIDPSAARGMSHYEWSVAQARVQRAMALGDFAIRVAQRIRAALRTAIAAVRSSGAPNHA